MHMKFDNNMLKIALLQFLTAQNYPNELLGILVRITDSVKILTTPENRFHSNSSL